MPRKPQFNTRLPIGLVDEVDATLAQINKGRAIPFTRTDLITILLRWWVTGRPDLDEMNRAIAKTPGEVASAPRKRAR